MGSGVTATARRDTERFLVTGALGCIGAWTVRQLVREGVPVVAFDLGQRPAPDRAHRRAGRARSGSISSQGDITDLANGRTRPRRIRHHQRHPPCRAAGAVLPCRPAARCPGQRDRDGQRLRGGQAARRRDGAGRVHGVHRHVLVVRRRSDDGPTGGGRGRPSGQPLRRLQARQRGLGAHLLGRLGRPERRACGR